MHLPESLQLLTDLLWGTASQDDLRGILEDILTPSEIVEVAERINILGALKQGKTQREIADELGISVTTVSRGARVLKYGKGTVEKYV